MIRLHYEVLCDWSLHTRQNGVESNDVVLLKSKAPDWNVATKSLADIPALVGELCSDDELDCRQTRGGCPFSDEDELERRRLLLRGDFRSTFIACISLGVVFRRVPG